MKYAKTKSEIPTCAHYAVLVPKTIYHEGDETSRQRPGHGYPAYTEHAWEYIVFETRDEWTTYIEEKTKNKEVFVPIHTTPATVSLNVSVDIK